MLTRLVIHDVVLIEKLNLELNHGLSVFTGETGAGKSILLDALSLALGGRADASLIRTEASQASMTAEFTLTSDHKVFSLAEEQGLAVQNPLVLRRVVARDGKSRAFVNDQPISVGLLKQFGETLLEIHGQFETHGLLNPASHRLLLDAYAKLGPELVKVRQSYSAYQEACVREETLRKERERSQAEKEFLQSAYEALMDLNPEAGEAETLAERRTLLQHREKILESLRQAEHFLEDDKGARNQLIQAAKAISRILEKAPHLKTLLATLDRATLEAEEAAADLGHVLQGLDNKDTSLDKIEERLFALRGMARKHNVTVDQLPALRDDFKTRLAHLSDQGTEEAKLTKETAAARALYQKGADSLSRSRDKAARAIESAVAEELPPLKLERARFFVEISKLPDDSWGPDGYDRVTFLASTNPGTAPSLLAKIASGGELARFMLALKVVLAENDPVPTLIFDEVDTGIGGATASAVGERLANLGKHIQILVITHSPQVAARGRYHFKVAKDVKAGRAFTSVTLLDDKERREEIARMLSGSAVTNAAREAAQTLLDDAEMSPRPKRGKRASA